MNDKDISQLMKKLENDPTISREFDANHAWSLFAERAGLSTELPETPNYGFRDYIEYYMWQFSHAMFKPVAATVAVFLFAITGWISAANVSSNSLPGDRMYPVKVAMEQAQLALAFGEDSRAKLQIEFTSRRLDEMVEIAASSQAGDQGNVQLAMERFKSEVVSIQEDLSSQQSTELAKEIGRKADVYSSTVTATITDLPEGVIEEVEEVIEDAVDQAVEVFITAHEFDKDEEAARELEVAFDKELASILENVGEEAADQIELAQTLRDEGAYRRAFQVLKEIEIKE